MSTFAGNARTNDFQVKDLTALRADLASVGITAAEADRMGFGADFVIRENPDGSIRILSAGTWPRFDEDSIAERLDLDEDEDVPSTHESLAHLIAAHLVDDEVAVFIEIGQEGFRYLAGNATAINNKGEIRAIDLEDIYDLATQLVPSGKHINVASY